MLKVVDQKLTEIPFRSMVRLDFVAIQIKIDFRLVTKS